MPPCPISRTIVQGPTRVPGMAPASPGAEASRIDAGRSPCRKPGEWDSDSSSVATSRSSSVSPPHEPETKAFRSASGRSKAYRKIVFARAKLSWVMSRSEHLSGHFSVEPCLGTVSYTHLRAHETRHDLVC